jgi:hypothetical protein
LNPPLEWVKEATSYTHRQKRQKTGLGEESSDETSDDDISEEESTQPLAKLLRNVNSLTKPDTRSANGIQRLSIFSE